ncbi:hypothetical protein AaE_009137, partial [Aphanomyces astaci]
MKVCQKVEEKHVTTYNEVADELVHEFVTMRPAESVMENAQRAKSVEQKKQQLQELLLQQIALKNLIQRNKQVDKPPALCRISLPFILVNTSKDTIIQCEMSEDRQDIFFN